MSVRPAIFALLSLVVPLASAPAAEKPARAVLFIIDGLHWQAPEKLALPNFQKLAGEGVLIERSCMVMPHHPVSGAWARMHNSSIPNPVMLAGTLFIEPGHRLVQEVFPRDAITAHAAGSLSYHSIDRGSSYSVVRNLPDAAVVDHAVSFMRDHEVRYLRMHLQNTGSAGHDCSRAQAGVAWRKNIWAEGSPYIAAAREADAQLGRFVQALKQMEKWDDTLLIVTSDHGQANFGWHPLLPEDSWMCPMLFIGPGIAKGGKLDYAEATDLIPTICEFLDTGIPNRNGGTGISLAAALREPEKPVTRPRHTREINEVLRDFYLLRAEATLQAASKDPGLENTLLIATRNVYDMDRFADWPEAGSLENLLRINREAVKTLRAALDRSRREHP
jgi:Sulfatase